MLDDMTAKMPEAEREEFKKVAADIATVCSPSITCRACAWAKFNRMASRSSCVVVAETDDASTGAEHEQVELPTVAGRMLDLVTCVRG